MIANALSVKSVLREEVSVPLIVLLTYINVLNHFLNNTKEDNMSKKKKSKLGWRPCTKEESEYYKEVYEKEREKYERDVKCGGVEDGHYVRLHDRYW